MNQTANKIQRRMHHPLITLLTGRKKLPACASALDKASVSTQESQTL